MTFFLHRDGFPKAECVARDGTGAGVCLFWFPEQPIFLFLSSHTEESCGPAHPALAGLVLHMREDLPLDSYIVICWHLPLDPHFPKMKKYRVTRSKQVEFLDQSPLSLSLSFFFLVNTVLPVLAGPWWLPAPQLEKIWQPNKAERWNKLDISV